MPSLSERPKWAHFYGFFSGLTAKISVKFGSFLAGMQFPNMIYQIWMLNYLFPTQLFSWSISSCGTDEYRLNESHDDIYLLRLKK